LALDSTAKGPTNSFVLWGDDRSRKAYIERRPEAGGLLTL